MLLKDGKMSLGRWVVSMMGGWWIAVFFVGFTGGHFERMLGAFPLFYLVLFLFVPECVFKKD